MERPESQGFTLIELVLAMTIMSVVVAVVSGGLWLGYRAWQRGATVMEEDLRIRTTFDILSEQLRSAFPVSRKAEEGETETPAFTGDSGSLNFITTLPVGYEDRGGLYFVKYFVERDPSTGLKRLKVYQRPVYTKEPPPDEMAKESRTLFEGLTEARWSYVSEGRFLDRWDPEEGDVAGLPERLRLTLTFGSAKTQKTFEKNIFIETVERTKGPVPLGSDFEKELFNEGRNHPVGGQAEMGLFEPF